MAPSYRLAEGPTDEADALDGRAFARAGMLAAHAPSRVAPPAPHGTAPAEFLAQWVQGWPANWHLNLCAIPADGGPPEGRSWPADAVARHGAEIAAWIEDQNAERKGVYFTPNPLSRPVQGKPKRADIAAPVVLAVDLDPPQDGRPYPDRRAAVMRAAEALADADEAPALILDSGNGIGAFFRVADPQETPIAQAEAACATITRSLAERHGLKADGTHNADRLMRLPGTLNWPNEAKRDAGAPARPSLAGVLSEPAAEALTQDRVAELADLDNAHRRLPARGGAQQGAAPDDRTAEDATLKAEWPRIVTMGSEADLPPALAQRLKAARLDRPSFNGRWTGNPDGLTDPSGSGLFLALVGCAKAAGFDLLDTARLAWVWQGSDHLQRQPTPEKQRRALLRAWQNTIAEAASPPPEVQAITDEGFFVVEAGSSVRIGRRDASAGAVTLFTQADFLTLKKNRHAVGPDGARKPAGVMWLADPARPTYRGMGLYPPDVGCPADHFNTWPGWGVPTKGGRFGCRRILTHLHRVICRGDKAAWRWLMGWLAWGVQNPGKKPEVAVVLCGGQGTGKGAVASVLERIYGGMTVRVATKAHLTGHFNALLADRLFVIADEAAFAGDPSIVGPLKALVTEPTMTIERKGVDAVQAPNRFRLMMLTNEAHAVHLDPDDRRFAVFQTAAKPSAEHFRALWAEIKGDGAAALLNLLLRLDVSGWNPRDLPATEARAAQKLASLTGVSRWWAEVLTQAGEGAGCHADWFAQGARADKATIYQNYEDFARRRGDRRTMPAALFWKELARLTGHTYVRPNRQGQRARQVVLPALDVARARAAETFGIQGHDWDA